MWLGLTVEAPADLLFTVTGNPGNPILTIHGSGSIQASGSPGSDLNSSFLKVPDSTPSWLSAGNNVGDYLAGTWVGSGSEGAELVLAGDLRLVGTGSASFSYTFDHLRFDDDVSAGGDDIDLRFDGAQNFPDFPMGITVSAEGSSTFILADGNQFEDLNLGRYEITGFGASGTETVEFLFIQAVPEPSSLVLMGMFILLGFRRRRCLSLRCAN